MKQTPNIISVCRIFFSLALLLINNAALFIGCYLVCGISDILDGYIARRYKLESKLGEKLDSLGDIVFWAVILFLLFTRTNIFTKGFVAMFCIVAVHRVANLLITKIKFKQWGMLHSWGNKITGLLLYILLPVCVVADKAVHTVGVILFLAAFLSSLDETAVLLSSKSYNANRKSYFVLG